MSKEVVSLFISFCWLPHKFRLGEPMLMILVYLKAGAFIPILIWSSSSNRSFFLKICDYLIIIKILLTFLTLITRKYKQNHKPENEG